MLIVAVICYCFWFAVSQDCSSVRYPNLKDLIANNFELQSTHVLIPQATFSGCGTITSCNISASCSRRLRSLHFILIQIWRKVAQGQYMLAQSVNATLPNGCEQGVVTFDNLGLSFQPDSILGVYIVTSTQPFIQLGSGNADNSVISGDLTEYYSRNMPTSPTFADLNQYGRMQQRTVGISVEVIKCATCGDNQPSTNGHDGAGIALGIILPLVFLVGLTVTVVIVVICLKRRCSGFRVSSGSSNEVRGIQGSPYEVPAQFPIVEGAGPYDVPIKNSVLCDSSESAVYAVAGMNVGNNIYWAPGTSEKEIYGQLAQFHREIAREDIKISKKIGQGEFGVVYKAELNSSQGSMEVAVKEVKKNSSEEERVKLLQEAAILGQFKHKHITSLLGVVTADQPVLVVMELLQGGSLLAFLRNTWKRKDKRSAPGLPRVLLRFSRQVAEGLAYLAHKSFVHRDIAARNVLLDSDLNCKISDFGMTRELQEETYYVIKHKGAIPVKWTAPEAIFYKKYSTSSDIWSFGMLMYEMWSLGHAPFEEMSAEMVVRRLRDPHCHQPPPGCPRAVYNIMVKCWAPSHSKRPSAHELVNVQFAVSDVSLLAWSEEDKSTSQLVDVLGAPLAEGAQLYLDLQHLYV